MKNKLGVADYGLNDWCGGFFNLEQRLELLKSCGVDGIEWLTAPDAVEALQAASVFHRHRMDFASCNMGNPELTMKCASAFGKEYVWLSIPCRRDVPFEDYCRYANVFVKAAEYYGLKAALHNHLGNRVQSQEEICDFMEAVPGVALLLDIGHLHAAGGDCVEIIRKYHDRLASVHFKDIFYKDLNVSLERWWNKLRFCELGGGNAGVDIESVARELQRARYSKWVLIEQDTHLSSPECDLRKSADVLKGLFE